VSLTSGSKNSWMKHQRIDNMQGFTLLELMIVLVLLGVLAGIAVPTYMGRADAARIQKVDADFSTIATALSLYKLDNSTLPTTGQGLAALVTKPQLDPIPLRYKSGGYINDLPLDPWNRPYLYLYPARSAEREYDLYTLGADGKTAGEGQDADISR
jgi:general secretion pathway protein G